MRLGNTKHGFTLIELLVVISIIGLLASIVLVVSQNSRRKAQVAQAVSNVQAMKSATQLYWLDVGFYPPDVNRGEDPGFVKTLPYSDDPSAWRTFDCNTNDSFCRANFTPGTGAWPNLPTDWIEQVKKKWRGPYMTAWPGTTPWGGEYDYNYWANGTTRYGCLVPPGIYQGVQRNYADINPIPAEAEQIFVDQRFDGDGCVNGEAQMILFSPIK